MDHSKYLRLAKGFRGRAKNCIRIAMNKVDRALAFAYVGRKLRAREMRQLWVQRINAASREHGVKYSNLIHAMSQEGVVLNRKMLAELAVHEPLTFRAVVNEVAESRAMPRLIPDDCGLVMSTVVAQEEVHRPAPRGALESALTPAPARS